MLLETAPRAVDGSVDLSGTLVVVTGGRFLRRIRNELVARCSQPSTRAGLLPPQFCTVASIARRGLELAEPMEVVSGFDWTCALAAALNEVDGPARALLVPHDGPVDFAARWVIAQRLAAVLDTAAQSMHSCTQIAQCGALSASPASQERWIALGELHERASNLCRAGSHDRCLTQLEFLEECAARGMRLFERAILIGVPDATKASRAILQRMASVGTDVQAWVIADSAGLPLGKSVDDCFDDLGFVKPGGWPASSDLGDGQIEPADGAFDQCAAAVARYSQLVGELAVSDPVQAGAPIEDDNSVVIVSADRALDSALAQTVDQLGRSAHFGSGVAWGQTLAGRFVTALDRAWQGRHPDEIVQLVEHPCIAPVVAGAHGDLVRQLARARDRQMVNHLDDLREMSVVMDTLSGLLGKFTPLPPGSDSPDGTWESLSGDLAQLVRRALKGAAGAPAEESALEFLDDVAGSIGRGRFAAFRARVDEVLVAITAIAKAHSVATPPRGDEVEVIGWLDAITDSAPGLVLLGVREGSVPAAQTPDGWFTDSLRVCIGGTDRAQRLARDSYVMHALTRRARGLACVAGRFTSQGDPAVPSRLLFPADRVAQARRVKRLLADEGSARMRHVPRPPAPQSAFLRAPMPKDYPSLKAPSILAVTDFKVYLGSPYQFWLEKVLGLKPSEPGEMALSPMSFGNLVHGALKELAREDLRKSTDAELISSALASWVSSEIRRQFGKHPKPGVAVQEAVLRSRLREVAKWHARQVAEGWRIHAVEWEFTGRIPGDQEGQEVKGRIDRIDHNAAAGKWRIIDFKTGDGVKDPAREMGSKSKKYRDLQLPLYAVVGREALVKEGLKIDEGDLEVGYVSIPALPGEIDFVALKCKPDDLEGAIDRAREVAASIRLGEFGSPDDPGVRDVWQRLTRTVCYSPAEPDQATSDGLEVAK